MTNLNNHIIISCYKLQFVTQLYECLLEFPEVLVDLLMLHVNNVFMNTH